MHTALGKIIAEGGVMFTLVTGEDGEKYRSWTASVCRRLCVVRGRFLSCFFGERSACDHRALEDLGERLGQVKAHDLAILPDVQLFEEPLIDQPPYCWWGFFVVLAAPGGYEQRFGQLAFKIGEG